MWGSTYVGLHFGLESFPPLMLGGIRFLVAGPVMLAVLRWRGQAWPTRRQWWNTARVAALMIVGGVGMVTISEDSGVGSGVTAAAMAIIPVWAALVSGLFGSIMAYTASRSSPARSSSPCRSSSRAWPW